MLVDTFPPEKQGAAQALFGIVALVAPVLGPTLGGYICDNYSWPWIFFIDILVGALAFGLNYFLLDDPDYLKAKRAKLHSAPLRFDYLGLGLIVLLMACMEIILSKGQEWDWYNDPFWRVQTLFLLFIFGLVGIVIWESRHPAPILNLAPFQDRNFVASCVTAYVTFIIIYAGTILLPSMLQTLFGYNAVWSGLVMSPAGLFSILAMTVAGFLLGKQFDARWLVIVGACLMAAGSYWYSQMNLFVSPWHLVWPRVVMQLGAAFLFAPLSVAAFMYLPKELRGPASGIYAVFRNEGGSAGTSLSNTLVERRLQFHDARLVETLDPVNPIFDEAIRTGRSFFSGVTGDPETSRLMALQAVDDLRQQQASAMSYLDAFWLLSVLALGIIPLAFLMRRSVAEKGAHIGAE